MTDSYCFLHLRGEGNNALAVQAAIQETLVPAWCEQGIVSWGVFRGLFGVASNELIVVAACPDKVVDVELFQAAVPDPSSVRSACCTDPGRAMPPRQSVTPITLLEAAL